MFEKNLEHVFPNICIMLRIFNTVPVSVAENERSFSKFKIVKNSPHSIMGQDHVTDRSIISIEKDLAKKVSYDNVTHVWAVRKARKTDLLASYSPFSKFLVDCVFTCRFKTNMLIQ